MRTLVLLTFLVSGTWGTDDAPRRFTNGHGGYQFYHAAQENLAKIFRNEDRNRGLTNSEENTTIDVNNAISENVGQEETKTEEREGNKPLGSELLLKNDSSASDERRTKNNRGVLNRRLNRRFGHTSQSDDVSTTFINKNEVDNTDSTNSDTNISKRTLRLQNTQKDQQHNTKILTEDTTKNYTSILNSKSEDGNINSPENPRGMLKHFHRRNRNEDKENIQNKNATGLRSANNTNHNRKANRTEKYRSENDNEDTDQKSEADNSSPVFARPEGHRTQNTIAVITQENASSKLTHEENSTANSKQFEEITDLPLNNQNLSGSTQETTTALRKEQASSKLSHEENSTPNFKQLEEITDFPLNLRDINLKPNTNSRISEDTKIIIESHLEEESSLLPTNNQIKPDSASIIEETSTLKIDHGEESGASPKNNQEIINKNMKDNRNNQTNTDFSKTEEASDALVKNKHAIARTNHQNTDTASASEENSTMRKIDSVASPTHNHHTRNKNKNHQAADSSKNEENSTSKLNQGQRGGITHMSSQNISSVNRRNDNQTATNRHNRRRISEALRKHQIRQENGSEKSAIEKTHRNQQTSEDNNATKPVNSHRRRNKGNTTANLENRKSTGEETGYHHRRKNGNTQVSSFLSGRRHVLKEGTEENKPISNATKSNIRNKTAAAENEHLEDLVTANSANYHPESSIKTRNKESEDQNTSRHRNSFHRRINNNSSHSGNRRNINSNTRIKTLEDSPISNRRRYAEFLRRNSYRRNHRKAARIPDTKKNEDDGEHNLSTKENLQAKRSPEIHSFKDPRILNAVHSVVNFTKTFKTKGIVLHESKLKNTSSSEHDLKKSLTNSDLSADNNSLKNNLSSAEETKESSMKKEDTIKQIRDKTGPEVQEHNSVSTKKNEDILETEIGATYLVQNTPVEGINYQEEGSVLPNNLRSSKLAGDLKPDSQSKLLPMLQKPDGEEQANAKSTQPQDSKSGADQNKGVDTGLSSIGQNKSDEKMEDDNNSLKMNEGGRSEKLLSVNSTLPKEENSKKEPCDDLEVDSNNIRFKIVTPNIIQEENQENIKVSRTTYPSSGFGNVEDNEEDRHKQKFSSQPGGLISRKFDTVRHSSHKKEEAFKNTEATLKHSNYKLTDATVQRHVKESEENSFESVGALGSSSSNFGPQYTTYRNFGAAEPSKKIPSREDFRNLQRLRRVNKLLEKSRGRIAAKPEIKSSSNEAQPSETSYMFQRRSGVSGPTSENYLEENFQDKAKFNPKIEVDEKSQEHSMNQVKLKIAARKRSDGIRDNSSHLYNPYKILERLSTAKPIPVDETSDLKEETNATSQTKLDESLGHQVLSNEETIGVLNSNKRPTRTLAVYSRSTQKTKEEDTTERLRVFSDNQFSTSARIRVFDSRENIVDPNGKPARTLTVYTRTTPNGNFEDNEETKDRSDSRISNIKPIRRLTTYTRSTPLPLVTLGKHVYRRTDLQSNEESSTRQSMTTEQRKSNIIRNEETRMRSTIVPLYAGLFRTNFSPNIEERSTSIPLTTTNKVEESRGLPLVDDENKTSPKEESNIKPNVSSTEIPYIVPNKTFSSPKDDINLLKQEESDQVNSASVKTKLYENTTKVKVAQRNKGSTYRRKYVPSARPKPASIPRRKITIPKRNRNVMKIRGQQNEDTRHQQKISSNEDTQIKRDDQQDVLQKRKNELNEDQKRSKPSSIENRIENEDHSSKQILTEDHHTINLKKIVSFYQRRLHDSPAGTQNAILKMRRMGNMSISTTPSPMNSAKLKRELYTRRPVQRKTSKATSTQLPYYERVFNSTRILRHAPAQATTPRAVKHALFGQLKSTPRSDLAFLQKFRRNT